MTEFDQLAEHYDETRGGEQRGRTVVGLDLSAPMLSRARSRLGPVVVLSDAMRMSIATASVAHADSVWVLHSVSEPVVVFREAARVIRPGGLYVVCSGQYPPPEDQVGQIISQMVARVDARLGARRPRGVTVDEVLDWAAGAGFTGTVHQLEGQWRSSPGQELQAIAYRSWPTLRQLDDPAIEEVTGPAIEALRALPATDDLRRATAEIIVLSRP